MIQFELVLYPEKQSDFEELDKRIRKWKETSCNEWVIARHEPFESEQYSNELHYHYFLHLHASWSLEAIANSLKIETNQIQKIKSKWITAILYARHINNTEGKPLIPVECVETNITDYNELCAKALAVGRPQDDHKVKALPQVVIDYAEGKISFSRLKEVMPFSEFTKYKRDIDNAKIYRNKGGINRNMRVIYITGGSGSGKTILSKFIGENSGYDIFPCGSGADPLDGYDNEECILLDDLRADVFTKAELFKLLDNNTNSAVKSRYFNKAITKCKLLIITSIKEPHLLYDWHNEQAEPFKQFARRLNYVFLFINKGKIYECRYDKEFPLQTTPKPSLVKEFDMQLVKSYLGIKEQLDEGTQEFMKLVSRTAREKLEGRSTK